MKLVNQAAYVFFVFPRFRFLFPLFLSRFPFSRFSFPTFRLGHLFHFAPPLFHYFVFRRFSFYFSDICTCSVSFFPVPVFRFLSGRFSVLLFRYSHIFRFLYSLFQYFVFPLDVFLFTFQYLHVFRFLFPPFLHFLFLWGIFFFLTFQIFAPVPWSFFPLFLDFFSLLSVFLFQFLDHVTFSFFFSSISLSCFYHFSRRSSLYLVRFCSFESINMCFQLDFFRLFLLSSCSPLLFFFISQETHSKPGSCLSLQIYKYVSFHLDFFRLFLFLPFLHYFFFISQ